MLGTTSIVVDGVSCWHRRARNMPCQYNTLSRDIISLQVAVPRPECPYTLDLVYYAILPQISLHVRLRLMLESFPHLQVSARLLGTLHQAVLLSMLGLDLLHVELRELRLTPF